MELFKQQQWLGEFFTNDNFDRRFFGRVDYSPDKGIVLEFWSSSVELPMKSAIVHGILENGRKCTLVGDFSPDDFALGFVDKVVSRKGKVGFACLLIGDFISSDELFDNINFSLSNLQEFFFPKGFKDLVKYSESPLLKIVAEFGVIKVLNNASFGYLHADITKQIYSRNSQALDELKSAFTNISDRYPTSNFMLKKDIEYRIELSVNEGSTLEKMYKYINHLADLFAILIYSPVHPESIQIIKKITDGTDESYRVIEVYPSTVLNSKTVAISSEQKHHVNMPITNAKVDLEAIVATWMRAPDRFSTVVSSIQNETGYREIHSLHGEIVLFSTQFEAISHDENQKNKKYEYPLKKYGTQKIVSEVERLFAAAGEEDVGVAIGKLRNEIVHVGRPKELTLSMSMSDLILLSQLFELTIIGYILKSIDVPAGVIEGYLDNFSPG